MKNNGCATRREAGRESKTDRERERLKEREDIFVHRHKKRTIEIEDERKEF